MIRDGILTSDWGRVKKGKWKREERESDVRQNVNDYLCPV